MQQWSYTTYFKIIELVCYISLPEKMSANRAIAPVGGLLPSRTVGASKTASKLHSAVLRPSAILSSCRCVNFNLGFLVDRVAGVIAADIGLASGSKSKLSRARFVGRAVLVSSVKD
jgi:hypothetical protein